jgi:pimeloyl-ACP methyl ester carboxylesterase
MLPAGNQLKGPTTMRRVHRYWVWQGKRIRYQRSGEEGSPVVLVHGFGGNW